MSKIDHHEFAALVRHHTRGVAMDSGSVTLVRGGVRVGTRVEDCDGDMVDVFVLFVESLEGPFILTDFGMTQGRAADHIAVDFALEHVDGEIRGMAQTVGSLNAEVLALAHRCRDQAGYVRELSRRGRRER